MASRPVQCRRRLSLKTTSRELRGDCGTDNTVCISGFPTFLGNACSSQTEI